MKMECKTCAYYKTYACEHLDEKTDDISQCYFGELKTVTRQNLIELEMVGVSGREEYREEITKKVMAMTDEEVIKTYNERIKIYY